MDLEFLIPEFEPKPKTIEWYLWMLAVVTGLMMLAYITQNYTFIALILIGCAFIIFKTTRKPTMLTFKMSNAGIALGNKEWGYDEIKSFSIFQIENRHYFIFIPKGRFRINIKIPIAKPEEIRNKLNNLVPEVEYSESLTEILGRVIGL